jgi:poly(3-hydroxybutyrate) depolymerase
VTRSQKNRQIVVLVAAFCGLASLLGTGSTVEAATKKKRPASTLVPVGGSAKYQLASRTESFVDTTRGTAKTSASPAVKSRTLPTLILTPQVKGKKLPLLVFSHGLGGEPSLYLPLLTAMAEAGYVVAAPTFPLSSARAPGGPGIVDQPNQAADVSFVITQMLKDKAVNPERVLVAGHSLGGITTVDLIGNPKLIDKRIDGAVVVAGTTNVFNFVKYFEGTPSIPVLFIHGDTDETVPYNLGATTFRSAKAPKWLLTVVGGNHSFGLAGKPDQLPQTAAIYADAMVRFADATVAGSGPTVSLQKLVDKNSTVLKLESVLK